jgi:UV DNA damage endonuclease
MRIGYACINMTLNSLKPKVTTNRGMVKKTFESKGLKYVSELSLENIKDLITIIKWNKENGIDFYRMSSDMFPWMSEYEFSDLPDYNEIKKILLIAGDLSKEYNQRLTFHPGPFNVLCSPKKDVVDKTIKELNKHSEIMDMMGLSASPYNKINIHVGGVYGDKESALERWCDNFNLLNANTKSRLTIENDDKESCYTVKDLLFIYNKLKVPIVFDIHHHNCHSGGISQKEAMSIAYETWSHTNLTPIIHVSEPRDEKNFRAHHEYVKEEIETFGFDVDIMMEAKAKELAVLEYEKKYKKLIIL